MKSNAFRKALITGIVLLALPCSAYAGEKRPAAKTEKSEQEQLAEDYRARRSGKVATNRTCPCASSNGSCTCAPNSGYGYGYGGSYYGGGAGYGPGWSRNYWYSDMPTTGYTPPARQ